MSKLIIKYNDEKDKNDDFLLTIKFIYNLSFNEDYLKFDFWNLYKSKKNSYDYMLEYMFDKAIRKIQLWFKKKYYNPFNKIGSKRLNKEYKQYRQLFREDNIKKNTSIKDYN